MQRNIPSVIPVLDLMIGQIVLATEGNRDAYLPVQSKLTTSSQPLDVAQAMFKQTGCDWLYLADIDSFSGAVPNWNVFNQLLDHGFGLWIDANWLNGDTCQQIVQRISRTQRLKVILSSETFSTIDQFEKFKELIDQNIQPIFSLDTQADRVITRPGPMADTDPLEMVQLAYDQGVRDVIVLDLDAVGTLGRNKALEMTVGQPAQPLIEEISSLLHDVRLISGGGVRDAEDIQALLNSGCHHVLVASAIHDCRLTPDDVNQLIPFSQSIA